MTTRLRFAPSPTGQLHVGNARTAILNWVYAKQTNGKLIVRIEDTDSERSTAISEKSIIDDLKWLGITWDEGPDHGGEFAPYRQSERLQIYREYVERLGTNDRAYPCFCSEQEIQAKRQAAIEKGETPRYDQTCLKLSDSERRSLEASGRQPVWRFLARSGGVVWNDLLKDRISFEGDTFGDFVILRSDGRPTYNFAAAVDDALMKITHVIRGDDHVSNTPKQLLIYEALGFDPPAFAHIPMILGPDRTRLSKRHGATSVEEFRKNGYLPEALLNFLSLLSWSSDSDEDILSVEKIVSEFAFSRMSKSPAIFDIVKLNWMNGAYIRKLNPGRLRDLAVPFLERDGIDTSDEDKTAKVVSILRDSMQRLSDITDLARPFYEDISEWSDPEAQEITSRETSQKVYWAFSRSLQNYGDLTESAFRGIMKQIQKETGVMGQDLWVPVRLALTGKKHGPDLPKVAEILGKDRCLALIKNMID